jgi:CRP/FNR family cyclic AMP-dependent transcriptional regulator
MQLTSVQAGRLDPRDLDVLLSLPLFSVLPEDEFCQAVAVLKKRRYAKGEVIYHQDDPPGSLFIVLDGAVKMERVFDNGRQHTIGWITKGDFFGTHSLFGVVTRTENAVAVTPCEVMVFGGSEFREFLHRNPPAVEVLLETVINKWRGCLDRFSESVLLDVHERTVRVLIRVCARMGVHEEDGVMSLPDLTQPELASWVGASRESVNRELKTLARMGLIRLNAGRVSILDVDKLSRLDPAAN